jgi:hypothetical protein
MLKTLTLFCLLTAAVAPAMGCKGSEGPAAEHPTSAQTALSADVARHSFGDLSRAVVSLLSQNRTLAQGRMLRCGSASKWRP